MLEPIEFIDKLRLSDSYIRYIYMNGGCYQFYKILKLLYPNAQGFKVKVSERDKTHGHIITKINDTFYDVEGKVSIDKYYALEVIKDIDISTLESWSFAKNNWLYRECPNCEEYVIA